ncbi:hypothetical protein HGRIS_010566 [Hohenbuehelia grisea]|uniref:Uncharacterized protein n=1 Tax=Hohenbuehelia grisea TaxID=104357 RepID=A0ABR3IXU2_9AGAR
MFSSGAAPSTETLAHPSHTQPRRCRCRCIVLQCQRHTCNHRLQYQFPDHRLRLTMHLDPFQDGPRLAYNTYTYVLSVLSQVPPQPLPRTPHLAVFGVDLVLPAVPRTNTIALEMHQVAGLVSIVDPSMVNT